MLPGAALVLSLFATAPNVPVVAVFGIEDARPPKARLKPAELASLTEYFATKLASSGSFRIVPNAELSSALAEKKKSSYNACYDESCQIEIGKEVAAQKTVATKILLVGKKCVVGATIYDLRLAASERSADAEGGCDSGALGEALKTIATKLAGPGEEQKKAEAANKEWMKMAALLNEMVPVPAGEFWMGCARDRDPQCVPGDGELRKVTTGAFQIDKYEVTVELYEMCVAAGRCNTDKVDMPFWNDTPHPEEAKYCNWKKPGREKHPMNCVTWQQAKDFCSWAQKRLPTETEWEKAARGTDGRIHPWGDLPFEKSQRVANIYDISFMQARNSPPDGTAYNDGHAETAEVTLFEAGASPYGAFNMVGNIAEWCSDPNEDGKLRARRGASWHSAQEFARCANRGYSWPENHDITSGIRCAR